MNRNEGFNIIESKYRVIYLWHGERHVLLETFVNREVAVNQVFELRSRGLNAWLEEIR